MIADDHLVFGCGNKMEGACKDHNNNLRGLLERARKIRLRFNSAKIRLWHEEVRHLDHFTSGDGLKTGPEKVAAIMKMQNPTDIKSMQRFIGFVNYLAKFLPNLSTICQLLCKLSCKGASWTWQSEQEAAFKKIKQLVTAAPVLQFCSVNKEVTVQCDANSSGLGAVLKQERHPIAYASKALTTTERNYAQIEEECLAIVFACTKFDQYIYGRTMVTIHTDHKPLETIFKKALLAAPKRLQCMLLRLQKCNLQVQYKRGVEMHIADFLTRTFTDNKVEEQKQQQNASTSQADDMDILGIEDMEHVDALEFTRVTDQRFVQIQELTKEDNQLQAPTVTILAGWPDTKDETLLCIREYWSFRNELTVHNGVIFRGNRFITLKVLRPEMLTRIHASHPGAETSLRKLEMLYIGQH